MTARQKPPAAANPVSDVFDLDAARAAAREAIGESFRFRFGGQTFTVPPSKEWPLSVTDCLSRGDIVGAMRLLLGDDQWPTFDLHTPTLGDVERLLTAVAADAGVTLPQ